MKTPGWPIVVLVGNVDITIFATVLLQKKGCILSPRSVETEDITENGRGLQTFRGSNSFSSKTSALRQTVQGLGQGMKWDANACGIV